MSEKFVVKYYEFQYGEDNSEAPILEKIFETRQEAEKFAQEKYDDEMSAVDEESMEFVKEV